MSTLTSDTVQNICETISDFRGESTTNTDASRIRAISRAERAFAKRRFFRIHLVKDQSIGTGDGTTTAFTIGTSTYPMRMKGLAEVFVGGTTEDKRIQVVDFNRYKNLVNNNAGARVAYEYYDQANDLWKVKLNPTPASGDVVTASWFYMPPKRTATTDNVVCEDTDIIAHLALAEIYHSEDELQLEQAEKKFAEDAIATMMGTEEAPAVNQTYSMASNQNIPTPRGMGSY